MKNRRFCFSILLKHNIHLKRDIDLKVSMAGSQCHAIKNKNRYHSIDYFSQEMKDD